MQDSAAHWGWPYVRPERQRLSETLPDGRAWPKISIVTPSFNRGAYIEETILSVAHQGYPNVEHIVIDGGSTDGTRAVLERHREKLAYVVSERDRGQSHAINKGMQHATGELLTWLNSDDMLAPGALAGLAMGFWSSGADIVAGVCQVYEDGRLVHQHLTSCTDGPLPLEDLLDLEAAWNVEQFFYHHEVMFTRELWERAGGRVDEGLCYSMDYELWVRFAEAGGRLHGIGRPVVWFRADGQHKTNNPAKFKKELEEWHAGYVARTGRVGHRRVLPRRHRLRILLVNDHGYQHGAGLAHQRMAEMLVAAGHEVAAVSLTSDPLPDHVEAGYTHTEVAAAVDRYRPDLMVVGNLHSAKGRGETLEVLAERCPTLVVMHDFWALTGRCAYPGECEKYLYGCDASCPTAGEYPLLEPGRIGAAWQSKRQARNNKNLMLLANSQWAAGVARRGVEAMGELTRVETFRLSFPGEVFKPRDRAACRDALGLPQDRFIVLSTSEFSDARKGTIYLLEALKVLNRSDIVLASTSSSRLEAGAGGRVEVIELGFQVNRERLAMAYAAADVMVGASRQETFGQIFLESAACGTPAVGFAVTGVAEALRDGVMGLLAREVSVEGLAQAIDQLYRDREKRDRMSAWGRLYVENEWSTWAAYRHLFHAWKRLGLVERFSLPHKISFLPSPPPIPQPQLLSTVGFSEPGLLYLTSVAVGQIKSAPRGGRIATIWKVTGLGLRFLLNRLARSNAASRPWRKRND